MDPSFSSIVPGFFQNVKEAHPGATAHILVLTVPRTANPRGGSHLSSQGTIIARVYTSGAQLPLDGVPVTFTRRLPDGRKQLLALLFTSSSSTTPPLAVEPPHRAESLSPGAAAPPFAVVDILVEAPGYKKVEATAVQVFPGVETIQLMQLIPLPTLGTDRGAVIYQPEPPQNL